jgi:hypothetical protein
VMSHLLIFAANPAAVSIAGMHGRNLTGNRYWSPDLAARATELAHRRHVLLLALSMLRRAGARNCTKPALGCCRRNRTSVVRIGLQMRCRAGRYVLTLSLLFWGMPI